ncbi:hypothetical protein KP509_1Z166100 [Ceratopteris richardii]|nr:hypothetical protein KP509_1Z166100 [Ceratopteris richardii]
MHQGVRYVLAASEIVISLSPPLFWKLDPLTMSPLPSAMVSLAGCSDAAIDSRNPNRYCRCIRLKRQVQRIENRVMEIVLWELDETSKQAVVHGMANYLGIR